VSDEIRFFPEPAAWRRWLAEHHEDRQELWVGFHKRGTGKPSITWPESVDQALCFGWIDGVRKSIDAETYKIRFTPRRATSIWSSININRIKELTKLGLVHPAGAAAFGRRKQERSGIYSYEQRHHVAFPPAYQQRLEANAKAWTFLQARAPWYRRNVTRWVMSAKREETRERRFATLIADSARGKLVGLLTPRVGAGPKAPAKRGKHPGAV
jgi:uncharacterized protein YdeI (YjbR/CyaY-like superfamily)